jgi:hypothetical protein
MKCQKFRGRGHVFLWMLACHVEWHARERLKPVLFDDDDRALVSLSSSRHCNSDRLPTVTQFDRISMEKSLSGCMTGSDREASHARLQEIRKSTLSAHPRGAGHVRMLVGRIVSASKGSYTPGQIEGLLQLARSAIPVSSNSGSRHQKSQRRLHM